MMKLNQIVDLCEVCPDGPWIAGGAARKFYRKEEQDTDYDIVCKNEGQFDYLCEVLMDANDDNKIIGRGWDIQTFDNLIDNVCAAKETYLSNNVKGVYAS